MISSSPLGLGIGWRGELASATLRRADLGFVEILAEDFFNADSVPLAFDQLHQRGMRIVPHGVGLSLGGATGIDPWRVRGLGRLAQQVQAPLVSEHLAFVRAGGIDTGHLLPLPRTREMLDILVENIRQVEADLPVPLALENIATLFEWPGAEMDEAAFLAEILDRTESLLLLDIENVYANERNPGSMPWRFSTRFRSGKSPTSISRVASRPAASITTRMRHRFRRGCWPFSKSCAPAPQIPGVMLERDDQFPVTMNLSAELDAIADAMQRGQVRRTAAEFAHHSA